MPTDLNTWRTANVLLKHHGQHAALEAAQHADACLERGDMEGEAVWLRVLAAIKELRRKEPREGEQVS